MLVQLGLLAGSLLVLTLGAEGLVRGSASLAKRMGVSSFFIGLTIVGFGTSTPELATSVTAAIRGSADIAVGNVVGSNICNIALILGVASLICPIALKLDLVRRETFIVIAVACVPWIALTSGGRLERWHGAAMLAGLLVYLWLGYVRGRRDAQREAAAAAERELEHELGLDKPGPMTRPLVCVAMVLAGLALLVGGSYMLVSSASEIARSLGISELVIGLTIVAVGTSAPELFTSVVAAVRGQPDLAVGNVLGSNVFNILGILGITCLATPQAVSRQVLWFDVPVMLAASLACLPIMLSGARISRAEGAALLCGYGLYVAGLFTVVGGWFGEQP
ncbi:MAG TPA: calcium/sodium antiporter [Phycisphaerales bacterium]|nr:calcium/sodium antiporter [Phycisphaerales bacterium]